MSEQTELAYIDPMDDFDESQIFAEELVPLIAQMRAICKRHRLPMTVVIGYASEGGTVTAGVASDVDGARQCRLINRLNRMARNGEKQEDGP